jgi:hypothetical protein
MIGTRRLARLGLPALLVAVATGAVGCGGPQTVYFRPAEGAQGAGPSWIAQVTYALPPSTKAVRVTLAARGEIGETDEDVRYERLNVRFEVRNTSGETFTLDPSGLALMDDEGRRVSGAQAWAGRNPAGVIHVAAGADATYELLFDLPPEVHLERLGSVRLVWPYKLGEASGETSTKFLRIEEVNYYYPDYYYYGPAYGPYYDRWYYDRRHGPWGGRRYGYGFYHGW